MKTLICLVYDIYVNKIWPKKPLFYASCPSKTEKVSSPKWQIYKHIYTHAITSSCLSILNLILEKYFNIILHKLEKYCKMDIRSKIVYKRINKQDFKKDYYSYKGNAYGLLM